MKKVKIDKMELQSNYYIDKYDNRYNVLKLIEESKKYKEFDLPLIGIDLSKLPWDIDCIDDMIYHIDRINNTDLKYPIILDYRGCIADGWHRICKAILSGDKTIKAIRLETMPDKDNIS